ncbi:DUF2768 domain-containing protein [Bacillus kwashiorkori]|uniref:DUF2768 domain-containing protein n=1 Tax=Bacillus kwashiorkori TaxID=1522318 RepID=UPI0007811B17|nr:DUF2768 domain-containing protein [Bacillus kwashiorkori]
MSQALIRMWISFAAMGFMLIAIILILLSRHKLKGVFRVVTATIAYGLMIYAGIIIFFIVFSGPSVD